MQEQLFAMKMLKARQLCIQIAAPEHVVRGIGFIGVYRHGANVRDGITDPTFLAIANELLAMQSASRLIVGKFFHASMNLSTGTMTGEIFYNEQFAGEDHKKEIHERFMALMMRFTDWLYEE